MRRPLPSLFLVIPALLLHPGTGSAMPSACQDLARVQVVGPGPLEHRSVLAGISPDSVQISLVQAMRWSFSGAAVTAEPLLPDRVGAEVTVTSVPELSVLVLEIRVEISHSILVVANGVSFPVAIAQSTALHLLPLGACPHPGCSGCSRRRSSGASPRWPPPARGPWRAPRQASRGQSVC